MPATEPPGVALRQRLILCPPPDVGAEALAAALRGGDVATVIVPPGAPGPEALVRAVQAEGVAALLAAETAASGWGWPALHGADGIHLFGAMEGRRAALESRPEGVTVGTCAHNRHEAMVLGEIGADYLWFGVTAALEEETVLLAAWWQSLFETPCVIAGPDREDALAAMIASDAEFLATDVFAAPDPAGRVAAINTRLERKAATS